jgi:hypothetical protein
MKTFLIVAATAITLSGSPSLAKPTAPVVLTIESSPSPAGGHDVTLVARPTRSIDAIELRLAGQRVSFGATSTNQRRVLRVHVSDGVDVVGAVYVTRGRSIRSAARTARIGTPAAAPSRPRTIETVRRIGNDDVLEVREVAP